MNRRRENLYAAPNSVHSQFVAQSPVENPSFTPYIEALAPFFRFANEAPRQGADNRVNALFIHEYFFRFLGQLFRCYDEY
jgi:hypothetical protein